MSSVTPLIVRWVRRTQRLGLGRGRPPRSTASLDHREHPAQPRVHARAPVRVVARDQLPVDVVLERPGEQHDQAHRVGAPPLDERHRLHDVALRLRHRGAAVDHLALVHQLRERLGERDHPHVVEDLREEPRVEQVQDRVLDAAGVLARPASSARRPRGGTGRPRTPASSTGRSTSSSRRTCPSCRCRARPRRRTGGTRRASRWDGAPAATPRPAGSRRRRAAGPAGPRRARRPRRRSGSARSGSARPSSAAARAASRAAGSSRSRWPRPSFLEPGGHLGDRLRACGAPSNGPLFTITPSPGYASVIASPSSGSASSGWITGRTGTPCWRANAKSRSSCAGTAMIAPVPYSISTYGRRVARAPARRSRGSRRARPGTTPSLVSASSRMHESSCAPPRPAARPGPACRPARPGAAPPDARPRTRRT